MLRHAPLWLTWMALSASAQGFDVSPTPWGPGRRSAGEYFHSTAEPLPDGPMRARGTSWSLAAGLQYFARFESRDNADLRSAAPDSDSFVDHRARFSLRGNAYERVGFLVEFQDVRVWGSERNTVTTEPFTGLHQGFVDFRVTPWFHLRVGRQELIYGEDRLLGNLEWAQSARAFDGLFLRFVAAETVTVDVFGMAVRERHVLSDATRQVTNEGSQLYGIYGRWRPVPRSGLDLYALGLVFDPATLASGPSGSRGFATLGGRGFLAVGPFGAVAEGAYQVGSDLAGDKRAWAFAGRLTFTVPVATKPYVAFEFSRASGDGDPTDGTQTTFNQLFPTGHIHLGYMDYVGWQNVQAYRGTAGFRPFGAHVWVDVHRLQMVEARDAWYNAGGGVFIPANPARTADGMGTEIDLSVTVPIHTHFWLAAAWGVFFPGEAAAVAGTIGKGTDTSHWGFAYLRSQF